ncbi:hypothetical protein C8J57DRAFT_1337881 [Mycena rebaudengoi]|nr:hypothetical protein C8J57DRAFT_1337881 [Mycena rebaudengoi]
MGVESSGTLISLAADTIPYPLGQIIFISGALLLTCMLLVKYALPTCMLNHLEKSLTNVEKIYYRTFDTLPLKADDDLAARLLSLQDAVTKLHLHTQRSTRASVLGWWGTELCGLFNGHSLEIWRCGWDIQVFQNDMRMCKQEKLKELSDKLASVKSPGWQLAMRQRFFSPQEDC